MRKAFQKPLWRIAGVAGLIALPLWGWMAALDNSLISGPRAPVPETQQIVPYQAKGQVTVYVTKQQAEIATWLSRVDFGLLGFIILCMLIAGPYSKNSN